MLRRRILAAATATVLALGMSVGGAGTALANPNAGTQVCAEFDSGKVDIESDPNYDKATGTTEYTAPDGKLVSGYCVKAGSAKQGEGPVFIVVDPPEKTVTIDHPTKDSISHWAVQWVDEPVVTPVDPGFSVTDQSCPTGALLVAGSIALDNTDTIRYEVRDEGGELVENLTALAPGDYTIKAFAKDGSTLSDPDYEETATVNAFEGDCDLTTEPLASVGFTWTSPNCDSAQTVAIDGKVLTNAAQSGEEIVDGNTVTFTFIADANVDAVFSDDASDAPTFAPADPNALPGDAPAFTWDVDETFTVLTVVITLKPQVTEGCDEPVENFLEVKHSQYCGGVDITLRNVSPWYYAIRYTTDGSTPTFENSLQGPVVDNMTGDSFNGPQKDASDTFELTFSEDANGGSVVVKYAILEGSERDLYVGLPVGAVFTVEVDTDCEPNPEPIKLTLTYIQECAPDAENTWRVTNESDEPVTFRWEAYGTDRSGELTAEPGVNFFTTERTSETMKIYWFDGTKESETQKTMASGNDIICDEIAFVDLTLACDSNTASYNVPDIEGVSWYIGEAEIEPGTQVVASEGTIELVANADAGYEFPGQKRSKTFSFDVGEAVECQEPSFDAAVLAGGACEADVPWIEISFSIDAGDVGLNSDGAFLEFRKAGFTSEFANFDGPNATVWKIVGGERVLVPNGLITEGGDYEARLLWPGASVDSEGNATGWPGWGFDAATGWFETAENENARWTRGVGVDPDVQLFLSVNPVAEIDVMAAGFTYPPATPECATDPVEVNPVVEWSYDCFTGGSITLPEIPGVIWSANGEVTEQREWNFLGLDEAPVFTASLDPERPGVFFAAGATIEWPVEFVEPEFGCDLTTLPLVEPEVTSTTATCEANGTYTLSDTEGVQWLVNGVITEPGTYTGAPGSDVDIQAVALEGYGFAFETQTEWSLTFPDSDELCDETPTDLPTLALTGASGMLGTVGIVALLITLTGIGAVVARRRVEV